MEYQSERARYDTSDDERSAKVGRPREEVATCNQVFPAPPINREDDAMVERPVPPLAGASACERVSAPLLAKLDVAVAPKDAVFALIFFANTFVAVAFASVVLPLMFTEEVAKNVPSVSGA